VSRKLVSIIRPFFKTLFNKSFPWKCRLLGHKYKVIKGDGKYLEFFPKDIVCVRCNYSLFSSNSPKAPATYGSLGMQVLEWPRGEENFK